MNGSLACRIVATTVDHASLVATAEAHTGRLVTQNDEIIGEWVPVAQPSLAADDVSKILNAVTRPSENGTELLVAFSGGDVTETEVAGLYEGAVDMDRRPALTLTLTDAGTRMFFRLTADNADRYLAIIVGGKVRSVPQILSPINGQFIIVSPTQAESTKLATVLKGL